MEEVDPQLGRVCAECVCVCVRECVCVLECVWSSYLAQQDCRKTTGSLKEKEKEALGLAVEESTRRPVLPCFLSAPFRRRLKAGSTSQQYAFGLQAAMGRAVMVGRGPTGAGVLVLPILVILAARSCRAQKGWWHTGRRGDKRPS